MEPYADVIIDLSVKNVDRIFQYRIPAHLREYPFRKGKYRTERDRGRSLKRDRL